MDNCFNTTKQILTTLKVKHTNTYIKDCVLSHPDHPSLLAIKDTLDKYNIENAAIKLTKDKLNELPTPCIVQVSLNGTTLFYTLNKITTNNVAYFDDKNKLKQATKEEFLKLWTGVCLLVEATRTSKEIEIEKKLLNKKFINTLIVAATLFLSIWIVLSFTKSDILGDLPLTTYTIIYSFLKLVGLSAGVFLLWFEVDQYNPTLQNFCNGSKKVDCNAVLKSKYATFLGGNLSLGLMGFSYFFASFIYLTYNNYSISTMSLLTAISIVTIPIVAISLYYQGVVIKQWCKFCVIIQAVLIGEIGIAFLSGFYKTSIDLKTLPLFAALLLIPMLLWKLIKPLLEQQKETNLYKRGLKKIKNNPTILESLLSKNNKISNSAQGLGITITNENAKYNVIKVCNPYCGPCAEAHPILEYLVAQGAINLQILFTTTTDPEDRRLKPVRHFLAINSKNDKNTTQTALDAWYNKKEKDYDSFAINYPMNGELLEQDAKIEAMNAWCNDEKISHTPTILINGYELPKEYSVEDLKEVLI